MQPIGPGANFIKAAVGPAALFDGVVASEANLAGASTRGGMQSTEHV